MRNRNFFNRMGRGRGFGMMDGTGPRAMTGRCLRYPQNNLTEYKQFLENELKDINKKIEENPV